MKKVLSVLIIFTICICVCGISACGSVVPVAWIRLEAGGGQVYYTADMYAITGAHIYLYENETDNSPVIEISFSPRILGADTVDGVRTTTVDISGPYAMYITVNKNNSIYSDDKAFYLNGAETPLVPDRFDESYASFKTLEFQNFGLIRGNPNGKINGVVNVIEYK